MPYSDYDWEGAVIEHPPEDPFATRLSETGYSNYPAQDTPVFPTYRDYPSLEETGGLRFKKEIPLLGRAERTPRVILGRTVEDIPGMVKPGTIDLTDPYKPTGDAFHIEDGGMHVVLPNWGSREAMIAHYKETGTNFGKFKDEKSADNYTDHLAKYQDLSGSKPYGLQAVGQNLFGMPTRPMSGRKDPGFLSLQQEMDKEAFGKAKIEPEPQESLKRQDRQVGMITPGNIDLDNLTPVETRGGDIDTLAPITITDSKKKQSVLIPTIIDGKEFPIKDAVRDYQKTGKHLGIFHSDLAASEYRQQLLDRQNQFYGVNSIQTQYAEGGGGRPGELAPGNLAPQEDTISRLDTLLENMRKLKEDLKAQDKQVLADLEGSKEMTPEIKKLHQRIAEINSLEGEAMPPGQRPKVFDVGSGTWREVDPKEAYQLGVPIGKPRGSGEQAPEGGINFSPEPWNDFGTQSGSIARLPRFASTAKGIPIPPPTQEESDRQIRAEQLDKEPEIRRAEPADRINVPELDQPIDWEGAQIQKPATPSPAPSEPGSRQAVATANRQKLIDAIAATEKQGYPVPHGIGTPNEPEGDRGPTKDMENLVGAMHKAEIDALRKGDQKKADGIAQARSFWEEKIKTEGMTEEQNIKAEQAAAPDIDWEGAQIQKPGEVPADADLEGATIVSKSLTDRVKGYEGWDRGQWDYGQYSTGYGTKAKFPGEQISKEEAERRLQAELTESAQQIDESLAKTGMKLNPDQRDALISFNYNLKPQLMPDGKTLKPAGQMLIETSDNPQDIVNRMVQYNKAGGSTLPALVQRRQDEARWFNGGALPPGADQAPVSTALPPAGGAAPLKPIAEPEATAARREVGFGESFSRENARMILGMGESLNRLVISPALQGVSEAARKVAPDSQIAKLTKKANEDWQTTMVDAVSSMRKSLEIDPNTEVQKLPGEAGGMIGNLFPQLIGAAATPGAIAIKFLLPAVTEGMDAMKRAREKGANPAQQIGAFAWGLASTEAFVNLPMHVQSAAAGPIMRFLERTMKGTLVAGGAHEALRDINNLITPFTGGEQQPFSLKELAKTALPMGIFGGVMGEDARPRPQGPIAEQAFPKGGEVPPPIPGGDVRFAPKEAPTKQATVKPGVAEALSGIPPRERIAAAAIRVKATGQVFQGPVHWAAADAAIKAGALPEQGIAPLIENGFVTNTGRFVLRKEALEIAQKSKQDVGKPEEPGYLDALTLPLRERTQVTPGEVSRGQEAPSTPSKAAEAPTGEERFAPGAPPGEPYDPNAPVPEEPEPAGVGLVASPETQKAIEEVKAIGKEIKEKSGLGITAQIVRAIKRWKARKERSAQVIEAIHKEITSAWDGLKLNAKAIKVRAEGITNYLQAGGDRATLQHWLDNTADPKLRAGYEAALNPSPREVAAANRVRQIFDDYLHDLRTMGYDVTEFKNYVTGMWQVRLAEKMGFGIPRTMSDYFRFKKQKFFENYFQGEQMGYKPLTKDIREIVAHYVHIADGSMNNRQLLHDLLSMTAKDGRPLLSAAGSISVLPRDITARREQAQNALDKWREGKLRKFGERNLDRYGTASMQASDRAAKIQEASSNKLEATLENLSEQRTEALNAAEEKTTAEHEKTGDRVSTKGATIQDKADYVLQERLAAGQGDREAALAAAADRTVREYGDKIDQAATPAEKNRIANEGNRIGAERARAINKYYDALEANARREHALISKTGDTAQLQRQIERESERRINERQKAVNDLFDEREKAAQREHDLTVKNADTLSKSSEDLLQRHAAQQSKTFTDLINDTYAKRQKKIDKMKGMSFLVDPSRIPKNLKGYVSLDFPALKNWKRMAFAQNGDPIYSKVDLLVHPDIAGHLRNIFGQSTLDKWWGSPSASRLEAYAKGITRLILKDIQQYYKGTLFAGIPSGFHAVHQANEMGLSFRIDPFRNLEKPDLINNSDHMDMANHGLIMGPDHAGQEYFNEGVGGGQKNLVTLGLRQLAKVKGIGYAENVANGIDSTSKWLFQHYIPALGIKAYRVALPRNMKRFAKELKDGTLSIDDIKDLTADQVNASTGHPNMEANGFWSNKNIQQALSMFLIAPHFTLGRAFKTFRAFTGLFGARKGREPLIGLGITAFSLWMASRLLNLITDGDPHWEWSRAFQVKVGSRWIGMRSYPGDLARAAPEELGGQNFGPWAFNRASPYAHFLSSWATGYNSRGQKVSVWRALYDMFMGGMPMPLQGLTNRMTSMGSADKLNFWEHLAGSMGFPIQRYNPTTEVQSNAREWQKKNTPLKVNTMTLPPSKYLNLEFALEENDPGRIKEEIANLKAQGMTLEKIVQDYAERIDHPYTNSKENDAAFSQSKFTDQNKLKLSRDRKVALIGRLEAQTGVYLDKPRDPQYFIDRGQ